MNNTDNYPTPEEAVARIHETGRWPTVYALVSGCIRRNETYATREDAERAASEGDRIEEINLDSNVWRLNSLLREDPRKVEEVELRLRVLGEARIAWTCTGHTRAAWQTAADAKWIEENRPDWKVVTGVSSLRITAA